MRWASFFFSTARPWFFEGVEDLRGEPLGHAVFAALAGGIHQPAQRQRPLAIFFDLVGDLVGRAPDAARARLQLGHAVGHRLEEDLQGVLPGLLGDDIEGSIDDAARQGFLALAHHVVDELFDRWAAVAHIGRDGPPGDHAIDDVLGHTGLRSVSLRGLPRPRRSS
jgi:hypothetical protein